MTSPPSPKKNLGSIRRKAVDMAHFTAVRDPHAEAIEVMCRGAARFVTVSEDAIAEAMRIYFDDTHQVTEGAGAAPLAALPGPPGGREAVYRAANGRGLIVYSTVTDL